MPESSGKLTGSRDPGYCMNQARTTICPSPGVKESTYDLIVFVTMTIGSTPNTLILHGNHVWRNHRRGRWWIQSTRNGCGQYPDWFGSYSDKYALSIPGTPSGDVSGRGFILGAGMVSKKDYSWICTRINILPC